MVRRNAAAFRRMDRAAPERAADTHAGKKPVEVNNKDKENRALSSYGPGNSRSEAPQRQGGRDV